MPSNDLVVFARAPEVGSLWRSNPDYHYGYPKPLRSIVAVVGVVHVHPKVLCVGCLGNDGTVTWNRFFEYEWFSNFLPFLG